MTVGEIAAEVAKENRGKTLLVAENQISGVSDSTRVSIVRVDRECLCAVWDGHIADKDHVSLLMTLGSFADVWKCESDAMAMTAWSRVWTLPPAPFRLFAHNGLRVAVDGDLIRLKRARGRTLQLTTGEIANVEVDLSDDWTCRSVSLVKNDGKRVFVTGERDIAPLADPTFDRINLMFEAGWTRGLAKALADAIGVGAMIPEPI